MSPRDYPARPPETRDQTGAPETPAQTGPTWWSLGSVGFLVLAGIAVLAIVAIALLV